MTLPIYEWPSNWYRFTKSTFRLQSRSLVTPRQFVGGKSVYGAHAQIWTVSLSFKPVERWDEDGQAVAAFFSRLEGQAGLIRIGDVMRRTAQANRLAAPTVETWSDGSLFDDGSGFISRSVPPFCTMAAPARRGEKYIVLGGLPVSQPNLIRRGDLVELRPNGVWTETPNLYEIQVGGGTNANGEIGVEIRSRLHQGFAAGDMAALDNAQSIFHLIDDDQGVPELSPPDFMSLSFNLVEAIV